MRMKRYIKIFLLVAVFAAIITAGYFYLNKRYIARQNTRKAQLAEEIQQKMVLDDIDSAKKPEEPASEKPTGQAQQQPDTTNTPAKYLLAMPFYSQAPGGNWDKTHEEMCEEASLLNAGLYLEGEKLSVGEYDRELLKMKDLEEKIVGTWVSTTVVQTKQLSDAYFDGKIQSKIIDNPTISQIEAEVSSGNPVIVPLAGREIGNPNYTPPGPVYHMLVVKGYDEKFFVTNDVGTRKGDSYVFKKEVIMDKMHDWNATDIHLGAKRVLVLYK